MKRWAKLNDRQLDVLRRVADVSEPVTSRQPELAQTVYALRDRGLVSTPRDGGGWTAQITEAGRFYLEHGYHPDRPMRTATRSPVSPESPPAGRVASRNARRQPVPLDELLRKLKSGGGVVRISDPDPATRAAWRRAIDAAKRNGHVPDGFHLRHRGRDRGDLVIELVEGEHPDAWYWTSRPPRIEVPDDLDESHRIVAELRRNPALLEVSENNRPRALRLMQALVVEAERRGHRLRLAEDRRPGVCLEVDGHAFRLAMGEEWETVEHYPDPGERGRKVYSWQRVQPERKSVPSGRLTLELSGAWRTAGGRNHWADRKRWRLEDKLAEVLAEVEAYAAAVEERRVAEEQAKERRQREWEQAMRKARLRFVEDHRRAELLRQAKAWQEAEGIRGYCDALEQLAEQEPDPDQASALRAWATWARGYADTHDPLLWQRPLKPPDPDPDPEDLRPYLGRWSPYGPEARY